MTDTGEAAEGNRPSSGLEVRLRARCVTLTPLHCGSGEPEALADAGLARRHDGTPFIPATTIAGLLRSAVEKISGARAVCKLVTEGFARRGSQEPCGCAVCRLFGDVRPVKDARASRVRVLDAPFLGAIEGIVDSVSIDRGRGAAAPERKFDRVEIKPGARLDLEVRLSAPSKEERDWVCGALASLAKGRLALGAHGSGGLGRLKCCAWKEEERDLAEVDELAAMVVADSGSETDWTAALDNPSPGWARVIASEAPAPAITPGASVEFTLHQSKDDTFLVNDPVAALALGWDHAPRKGSGRSELPGPSLRGVLRSQSERILRTLGGDAAACDPTGASRCGSQGRKPHPDPCLACRLFGNEARASRLRVCVVPEQCKEHGAPFDHVAIDRFTGGASEHRKFDALAAMGTRYRVRVEFDDTAAWIEPWMCGLVLLALGDLHDGLARVGWGAAKGHGRMHLEAAPEWEVAGHAPNGSLSDLQKGWIKDLWRVARNAQDAPADPVCEEESHEESHGEQ